MSIDRLRRVWNGDSQNMSPEVLSGAIRELFGRLVDVEEENELLLERVTALESPALDDVRWQREYDQPGEVWSCWWERAVNPDAYMRIGTVKHFKGGWLAITTDGTTSRRLLVNRAAAGVSLLREAERQSAIPNAAPAEEVRS